MKRTLLAAMIAAVSACSSTPYVLESSAGAAQLSFRQPTEDFPDNRLGGIFAVDGHEVKEDRQAALELAPGLRTIGYLCPGWMFIDGYPTVRHDFAARRHYELSCVDGKVQIRPVNDA